MHTDKPCSVQTSHSTNHRRSIVLRVRARVRVRARARVRARVRVRVRVRARVRVRVRLSLALFLFLYRSYCFLPFLPFSVSRSTILLISQLARQRFRPLANLLISVTGFPSRFPSQGTMNGICVPNGDYYPVCQCYEGYTGDTCSLVPDFDGSTVQTESALAKSKTTVLISIFLAGENLRTALEGGHCGRVGTTCPPAASRALGQ